MSETFNMSFDNVVRVVYGINRAWIGDGTESGQTAGEAGNLYVEYNNGESSIEPINLGPVTMYPEAVANGYVGTESEWYTALIESANLSDNISDLKTQIIDQLSLLDYLPSIVKGSYYNASGGISSSNKYARTNGKINGWPTRGAIELTSDTYEFNVVMFDDENEKNGRTEFGSTSFQNIPKTAAAFAINFKRKDGANISDEDIVAILNILKIYGVTSTRIDQTLETVAATSAMADIDGHYLNYGYGNAVLPKTSTTSPNKFYIVQNGQYITVNGGPNASSLLKIKLNGLARTTDNSTVDGWTTGTITLKAGHAYKMVCRLVSGEVTDNSYSISLYQSGSHTSSGTAERIGDDYIRYIRIGANDVEYNLVLIIGTNTSCTNAKFLVYIEDLFGSEDFDYFEQRINDTNGYIQYYLPQYQKHNIIADTSATDGTQVGISKYGTLFKLNVSNASAVKRVKITGEITRNSGTSTYKSWVGSLQLIEGQAYVAKITKVSGVGKDSSDDDYFPGLHIYESEGSSTIAESATYDEAGNKSYKFIAPSGPINIAIYIASGVTLTDFVVDITLSYWTDPSGYTVKEFYRDELADTIEKVRKETTSPCLVFPWTTDQHRFSNNAGLQNFTDMIDNMRYMSRFLHFDFILNTGDLTDGSKTQPNTLKEVYQCFEDLMTVGVPYVFCMGNHDENYTGGSGNPYLFTIEQCYAAYFTATKATAYNANENGLDYYIDFNELGVRFIVLCANNVKTQSWGYSYGTSTAEWLTEALNTTKKVIVAIHQTPYTNQISSNQSTKNSSGIKTALENFHNNGGSLILITGHTHVDTAFINPFLCVNEDCQRHTETDGYYYTPETDTSGCTGYIYKRVKNARTSNTYKRDLWSVCVYKPFTNELSCIRFGSGSDRYFHVAPIAPTTVTTKLSGTITWMSSDDSVATVYDGIISSVGAGKCAILAIDEEDNYECWIVNIEQES